MPSLAYGDYVIRLQEARWLLDQALAATDPTRVAALCKGGVVLTAAALERYINDVVSEACRQIKITRWDDLSEGQQRYMARQIAKQLHTASERVHVRGELTQATRNKLHKAVVEAMSALISPATWSHDEDYGPLMQGAAEPARIDATLKMFSSRGQGVMDFIDSRGADRGATGRALQSLVEARHNVAHALSAVFPSPVDVRNWVTYSILLTRSIEAFLGFRT